MLASERIIELVDVLLSADHIIVPTFDVHSPHIQQLINEEILRLLLIPTFSLSSQLLFDQPDEELVEVCLIGSWDKFIPERAV